MGMDDDAQIISVIGGAKRSGRWRVPASTRTLTLFGRCLIDLRQAETTADELSFSCVSAFAGVTFIVPEGAEVRPSGMAILGSARSLVPVSDTPGHLPPISIDAITVFGRLRIRTTDEIPEEEVRDSWRARRRVRGEAKAAAKATAKTANQAARAAHDAETAAAERAAQIALEGVDLKPSVRHDRDLERGFEPVDPAPIVRPGEASAPDLFGAPRTTAPEPTVDPIPTGTIDEIPTPFVGDEFSPLENLRVPDTADEVTDSETARER